MKKFFIALFALMLLPISLASEGQTQTIQACYSTALKGSVEYLRLATVCRPDERAISWSQGGASDTLSVFDSTGKRVGPVVAFSTDLRQGVVVAFQFGGLTGLLSDINSAELRQAPSSFGVIDAVYFVSSDCSGQAYVVPEPYGLQATYVVGVDHGGTTRVLYAATSRSGQQLVVGSSLDSYEGNVNCRSFPPTNTGHSLVPATPLVDLNTLFVPQFQVR